MIVDRIIQITPNQSTLDVITGHFQFNEMNKIVS
jgi:hypothetical protein